MLNYKFLALTIFPLLIMGCSDPASQSLPPEKIVPTSTISNETNVETVPVIKEPVVETLLSDEDYTISVKAVELGPTKVEFAFTADDEQRRSFALI